MMMSRKLLLVISGIFLLGFIIRAVSISPGNIIFDYDQTEDLYHTRKILLGDPPVIGRAVYGNPKLHHGVLFYYYLLIPFITFSWNPILIAFWNSIFNTGVAVIVFLFARSLFKKVLPALIAAFIVAVSYEFVQFSGWLAMNTLSIVVSPLYFLGLWLFYKRKQWALVLAALCLGLSLQLDLVYLYFIPLFFVYWLLFRPKMPQAKIVAISVLAFLVSVSTLIFTEIKLKFAGVDTLLHFSNYFDDASIGFKERVELFLTDFFNKFAFSLMPDRQEYSVFIGISVLLTVLFFLLKPSYSQERKGLLFLLIYLFAPVVTLFIGYHKQPWFLIATLPAVCLVSGYAISKIKHFVLILPILLVVALSNIEVIAKDAKAGPSLFHYEDSVLLSSQLSVVDYTYGSSSGHPFAINTVTYPLYYNAMWSYHYKWYGLSRYGYLPRWLGGDPLPLYDNILPRSVENEAYWYLIIDNTSRIPEVYKLKGKEWMVDKGKLLEEVEIGGFTIQKIER